MDLNTVAEIKRVHSRESGIQWSEGDAWLAGGTWLFSEPQPAVRRLIDLDAFGWPALLASEYGLEIAATCPIVRLAQFEAPAEWRAAPLFRECCRALLASFKIWNTATVGGNLCMSLPAGAMISLAAALEGTCVIWLREGGERHVAVEDFVTDSNRNLLRPGDLLRAIELPVAALRKRTAFRRMALTHLGRSTALLIATMNDNDLLRFSITAATRRPVTIEFACLPKAGELRARLIESIPDALYFDDVHGTPEYRRHITGYLAEQIRQEFERGVRL